LIVEDVAREFGIPGRNGCEWSEVEVSPPPLCEEPVGSRPYLEVGDPDEFGFTVGFAGDAEHRNNAGGGIVPSAEGEIGGAATPEETRLLDPPWDAVGVESVTSRLAVEAEDGEWSCSPPAWRAIDLMHAIN
jgi:hypothetical protein